MNRWAWMTRLSAESVMTCWCLRRRPGLRELQLLREPRGEGDLECRLQRVRGAGGLGEGLCFLADGVGGVSCRQHLEEDLVGGFEPRFVASLLRLVGAGGRRQFLQGLAELKVAPGESWQRAPPPW